MPTHTPLVTLRVEHSSTTCAPLGLFRRITPSAPARRARARHSVTSSSWGIQRYSPLPVLRPCRVGVSYEASALVTISTTSPHRTSASSRAMSSVF
jgi:hypothetical protein